MKKFEEIKQSIVQMKPLQLELLIDELAHDTPFSPALLLSDRDRIKLAIVALDKWWDLEVRPVLDHEPSYAVKFMSDRTSTTHNITLGRPDRGEVALKYKIYPELCGIFQAYIRRSLQTA